MKIKEIITKYIWQILTLMFVLLFLGKGCTSKKIGKTNNLVESSSNTIKSKVDSLIIRIHSLESTSLTSEQAKDIMEGVMLDFLIYEDDLDKGKTSLSQIKNKIEQND